MSDLLPMIRLDLANLAAWRRAALPVLLVVGFMAWTGGLQMAGIMLYMMGFMLSINSFTMDEQYHLPLLYGGLPVTCRQVITSHYVVAALAFVLSAVLVLPAALLSHLGQGLDTASEIGSGLGTVLGTSVFAAICLPLVVRFGPRAMAYVAIGFMAVLALVVMGVRSLGWDPAPQLAWVLANPTLVVALGLVVLAVAWFGSWLVSVGLFERKDF